ncbi:hypothetical protein MKK69_23740 [Methylobacterium sp. J-026]|uniref:hypothetical protein n=1 Tax=Methylobacterium sp. J-026 TaxID=2836624 RepID=UPI001FB8DC5C|nr:hypothetical protein [Methylobacterium sp. J-026]MCJ2137019.1 hypothetical protein [Methylobacterium sp. J-026]
MPKTLLLAALAATAFAATTLVGSADAQTPDPARPPATETPSRDQSLSDRLRQNDGVIKPPETGTTGTVVSPDQSGSMPVIKPNELPGRSPGTEAK